MREIKEKIKHLIEALSRQGAPADWNINPGRSKARKYHLKFDNKLHSIIFVNEKIKDKNDGFVEIKLVDTITGKIAEVGALPSIKIEIVVLDGNFGFEENGNWTGMDFNAKVVKPRKLRLVKGKQKITLRGGVGSIEDLSFTDNSSWIKGRKFRLGARAVESNSMGQVIFKEAVSEAFVVRDKRQKELHLGKIIEGDKFHQAFIAHNILTGSDLKKMYETDPEN
ncbi:hypothetical protein LWI29_010396 [Acer saccharum]|uniref:Calmodulin binding protein-like N-terminal domain-containing protein n=1 Tax=Acer saccharum TaxID=4024 RepID=A0AA39VV38_ACESA|nr:hypothetical protein LWI29_010396 [Acer saccharum]